MKIYRGDTFEFDFNSKLSDGTTYIFKAGDTLKIGVKEKTSNAYYVLFKEMQIEKDTDVVTILFSPEEMRKCNPGTKVLEVELTEGNGRVRTLYQDNIEILEDIINE